MLLATVLAYAGLIGAAAVTAQAADNAPVVQPVTAQTCVDIAVEAELSAADADNDVVLYQLTEKPRLGTAKIEGSTLYYTPGRKAGRDSFHYTAGTGILNWAVDNTKWIFLQGDGSTSVYYCIVNANTALHADVLAEDGKITVSADITRSQLDTLAAPLSIKISATAVQYHGFSEGLSAGYTEAERAEAAWNAVKGK